MSMRHKMVAYCCGTHGLAVGSSIEVITSVSKMKPFRAVVTISPYLEVATPTRHAFSVHGGHALSWQSLGHSLAAYLWRHFRQTVVLPGKCMPDSTLTR